MALQKLPVPSMMMGQHILQFEEEEMGKEFEERARNELRETQEVVDNAINALRNLLRDDEELSFPLDDEKMLLQFLRPCKFYPESACEKIKKFYTFKLKNPKLYHGLLPSTIKTPLLQDVLTALPLRNEHGRRMFLVEIGKWNVKTVSLNELFRCVMLLVEIAITECRTQISGVDVIFDLEGLSIQHVYQFGPSFARNALHWAQECAPLRFKSHHILNQPYVFNMLFAVFKPFLSEKFRNRVYLHGNDYGSLETYIDRKYLPKKYGGELDIQPFNRTEFHQLLCNYEEVFEERNQYGYKKNSK